MKSSGRLVIPASEGMFGTMVEPSETVAEYLEKDPTGRYVRVFRATLILDWMITICCFMFMIHGAGNFV